MTKNYSNKECVRCKKQKEACDDVEFYGLIKIKQGLNEGYKEVPCCICMNCGRIGNCEDNDLFIDNIKEER